MRHWVLLVVLLLSPWVQAQAAKDSLSLDNPPFYLPNHEELTQFDEEQKAFFFSRIEGLLQKVPALQKLTRDDLLQSLDWDDKWLEIMTAFYRACKNSAELQKTCERAADVRLETLMKKANQKLENREAEKKAKASQKKKHTQK